MSPFPPCTYKSCNILSGGVRFELSSLTSREKTQLSVISYSFLRPTTLHLNCNQSLLRQTTSQTVTVYLCLHKMPLFFALTCLAALGFSGGILPCHFLFSYGFSSLLFSALFTPYPPSPTAGNHGLLANSSASSSALALQLCFYFPTSLTLVQLAQTFPPNNFHFFNSALVSSL